MQGTPRLNRCTHTQIKTLESKCKELRDELKDTKDRLDLLEGTLVDLVPRADLNAARKVCVCMYVYAHTVCVQCMYAHVCCVYLNAARKVFVCMYCHLGWRTLVLNCNKNNYD